MCWVGGEEIVKPKAQATRMRPGTQHRATNRWYQACIYASITPGYIPKRLINYQLLLEKNPRPGLKYISCDIFPIRKTIQRRVMFTCFDQHVSSPRLFFDRKHPNTTRSSADVTHVTRIICSLKQKQKSDAMCNTAMLQEVQFYHTKWSSV